VSLLEEEMSKRTISKDTDNNWYHHKNTGFDSRVKISKRKDVQKK
jgi:hypothetical protein